MLLYSFFKKEKEIPQIGFPQDQFIEAVRQGGIVMERATKELMEYFRSYPYKFKNWYGLDKEEAIDAYTDAVMVVISYIRLDKLDTSYSLSTYLYRLTKNKCIDCLRQKGRGKRLKKEEVPQMEISDERRGLLHELLLSEVYHSVLGILEGFKGKCKEIILKWGYWGYSMAEIAEALGFKSPEVVRTQKSRCVKRLRQEIDRIPDFPTPRFK